VLRPPTAEQILAALHAAVTGTAAGGRAATDVGSAMECYPPGGAIRTDRPRRAAMLPAAVRAVHHRVLQHFAETGTSPTPADLAEVAAGAGVDPVAALQRLAADDLVAVDDAGRLVAAYPFSPAPTAHVVDLGGVRVYAMCAIDALGMPFMLAGDATITSTDPHTGQPVTVTVTGGMAVFSPEETVVVYAATDSGGRSVDTCCSTINFFAHPTTARAWIGAHPGLTATVLDQPDAVRLSRDIFGPLLPAANPGADR
jgi:hypothetical protein